MNMQGVIIIALVIVVCVLWERESVRSNRERDERIREARRDKTWEERQKEMEDRDRRFIQRSPSSSDR
jgi:Flp pilus assembly protein TadB